MTTQNECPITGQDHNLYLHRAISNTSSDDSLLVHVTTATTTTGRDSFDEPHFGDEEASEQLLQEMHHSVVSDHVVQSPASLTGPCSQSSSPLRSNASSTSSEEMDVDELYPHHKKFRMHRKRIALSNLTNANKDYTSASSINTTTHDDSSSSSDQDSHDENISINSSTTATTTDITADCKSSSDLTGYDSGNCSSSSSIRDDDSQPAGSPCGVGSRADDMAMEEVSPVMTLSSPVPCTRGVMNDLGYASLVGSPSSHFFHSQTHVDQMLPRATNEVHRCQWLQCARRFLHLDDLVNHVNDAHIRAERDIDYKCYWNNCPRKGKGFNARYKMLIHVRTHTNERPYKCNLCTKSFSRLENLKIHNRSHTGERPYLCPFEGCNKAYSNSSDRFKHVRTHQEQKPYCCRMPGCDKRYTDPSSLRKHIKTHGHFYKPAATPTTVDDSKSELVLDSSDKQRASNSHSQRDVIGSSQSDGAASPPHSSHSPASSYSNSAAFSYTTNQHLLPPPHGNHMSLTQELNQMRAARQDYQKLLDGSLLAALALPRLPLLPLPLSIPDAAAHYSLNPLSGTHTTAAAVAHLSSLPLSSFDRMASLGSTGSLSPGSLSDSYSPRSRTKSSSSDSEGSNSPFMSRARPVKVVYNSHPASPNRNTPFSAALNVSVSPLSSSLAAPPVSYSAFSPIPQQQHNHKEFSLMSPRTSFVSRRARLSPTHPHPYARPTSPSAPRSPPKQLSPLPYLFSHLRTERPLDLSNPSSPEHMSDYDDGVRSPLPASPHYLPMRCHYQAPRCDLGPAFPALHLLNHV